MSDGVYDFDEEYGSLDDFGSDKKLISEFLTTLEKLKSITQEFTDRNLVIEGYMRFFSGYDDDPTTIAFHGLYNFDFDLSLVSKLETIYSGFGMLSKTKKKKDDENLEDLL